jgi:hypothetical protein
LTALQAATQRYQTAPWKSVREDDGVPGLPNPAIDEQSVVHRREHEAEGEGDRDGGAFTIGDPIEAFEEALGLIGQLRHALGFRMGSHRNFESRAAPELEGAEGG